MEGHWQFAMGPDIRLVATEAAKTKMRDQREINDAKRLAARNARAWQLADDPNGKTTEEVKDGRRVMRFRQTVCMALVAVMVAGSGQWVDTFYDDTHYAFTYYMARECGFTPLQSHRLASANLAVDYSIATEPVGEKQQPSARCPTVTSGDRRSGADIDPVLGCRPTAACRLSCHAKRAPLGRGQEAQADQAIRLQEAKLWASALALRNPGVLLQFVQDEPYHAR